MARFGNTALLSATGLLALAALCLAKFEAEELLMYAEMDERWEQEYRQLHASGRSLLQGLGAQSANGTPPAVASPPAVAQPATSKDHCSVTIGTWCGPFYEQTPTKRPSPPRGSQECPNNCNGVGQCQYDTGLCYCPVGFGGPDCTAPRKRPCWRMGADKRDEGWHVHEEWSHSRCAGICDDTNSMCYCPPETKFGRIEAPPGSPPGSPPNKTGRPMYWCQPATDKEGKKVKWGAVPYENLYGPNGWCNAEVPVFMCPCRHDGLIGSLCNIPVEMYCINQCSGRGECQQGFCKCHEGWYGHDCSRKKAGLSMHDEPDQVSRKPWLQPVITPPIAAEDPPVTSPTRTRPYIYIYDVKTDFSSDILQYRIERFACSYRHFEHGNRTVFVGYSAYSLETLLHEALLGSAHRTYDPEEADYFYVPIMWACLFDVYGWNPVPRWPADVHGARPYAAAMMQRLTAEWLNASFPWYARRGGRDHIWLTSTDEGACCVWKAVWPGIFLTHWGRTEMPHMPNTQYHADYYSHSIWHKEHPGEWLDQTSKAHPCFDPKKDLVIPAFKRTAHFRNSPYLGAEQQPRDIFLFFRGDLRLNPGQDPECKYSRCIRQRLFNLSTENDWPKRFNVILGDTHAIHGDYSELLAKSLFCLVPPGDGWSPRMEDAVLHGCIPVIIMDQVQVVYESILDVPSFSVRVAEKDLASVIDILKAVPQDKIKSMQDNLAKVWMRYRWLGTTMADADAREVVEANRAKNGGVLRPNPGTQFADVRTDDALSTLMQWLYAKIPEIHGSTAGGATAGAAAGGATGSVVH
ncbi:hypothetical protein HYH03_013194 [Edaphochlamys debaryana]|uniref:EGF-like domain-containing protein n=1 Tax=Edaphochlamys debaryana TaxID=47281 RepID=A0A836BTC7_9CHLO|nr:hypothetical protein HYH03_013194 [Edaphochlamys debaryana]|eukprot:KAG2488200.1 hypothetical protein HYH03_013194 [Edaphochlamys debaryana]